MSSQTSDKLPKGWFRAGDHPENYAMGIDSTIFHTKAPSGFIKSLPAADANGFGTLMQNFIPKEFLGKRVRLSAFVKHENILDWAGLWMRVDSANSKSVLDNMHDRKIRGTGDWLEYENVLDVPEDTTLLAFGILLGGQGTVWLDDCKFEVVDPVKVPTTAADDDSTLDHPINLSF